MIIVFSLDWFDERHCFLIPQIIQTREIIEIDFLAEFQHRAWEIEIIQ